MAKSWLSFLVGVLGLLAGLALDGALFWTEHSFRVLFAAPLGLAAAMLCYWLMSRRGTSR